MKKYYKTFFLILITCSLFLCACNNSSDSDNTTYTVSTTDILDSMVKASSLLPSMDTVNSDSDDAQDLFAYICDFDYSKVDSFSFTYSSKGSAEEISVIKLNDESYIDTLKKSLQDRITTRSNTFKSYKPEEVPTVEKAIIITKGPYMSLIITSSPIDGKKAFESFF